jgi:hypothetical protein
MTRKIPGIPVLPTLSLLLLVIVVTLWARSPRHADILMCYTPAAHLAGVASDHGGLLFCKTDVPCDSAMSLSAETMSTSSGEFVQVRDLLFDLANQQQHLLGFRWAAGKLWTGQWAFGAVIVPYWALVIPLAILPLNGFRKAITRMRRKRRGQCLTCGYDLRHTSERCPECGTPIGGAGNLKVGAGSKGWRHLPAGAFSWLLLVVLVAACTSAVFRGRHAAAVAANAPPEQAVLCRVVGPIDLQNPTLLQSVTAIARAGNTRIELSGIDAPSATAPIKSRFFVNDVNLGTALRLGCEPWSEGRNLPLQLWVSGPVVRVALASKAPQFVRSYPVAALLSQIQADLNREADEAVALYQNNSVQGVSNRLFSNGPLPGGRESSEELADLISSTVLMDQMRDNGGAMGDLRIAAGRVWVLQTQEGHAAVRAFLALLQSPTQPASGPALGNDHANLDQLIPEVKLESTTLEAAIDSLREMTHSNIVVCWAALEAAGMRRDAPIKLHLWNVSLGQALDVVLTLAGGDASGMQAVQNGIIIVATPERIRDKGSVIRMYDIRDLVEQFLRDGRPPGAFTRPAVSNPEIRAADSLANGVPTFEEMVESITRLIEDAVDTDSWKDNGGSAGAIRELAGRLIITQTPSGHRQIVNLLRTLRAGVSKDGTELPSTKPSAAR